MTNVGSVDVVYKVKVKAAADVVISFLLIKLVFNHKIVPKLLR